MTADVPPLQALRPSLEQLRERLGEKVRIALHFNLFARGIAALSS